MSSAPFRPHSADRPRRSSRGVARQGGGTVGGPGGPARGMTVRGLQVSSVRTLARLGTRALATRALAACGLPARDARGTVAIMTAILGGTLAGFVALAVDVGTWEASRGAMQGAADQAAMAASYAIVSATMAGQSTAAQTTAARKEARGLAAAQGFVDGVGGVAVAVNIPPGSGPHAAVSRAVEVVITQPQQVLLGGMILGTTPTASARAVAVPGPVSTCLMALAPAGYGITDAGLGTVAVDCDIYVNAAVSPLGCDVALAGLVALSGHDVVLGQPPCPGIGGPSVTATDRLRANAAPSPDPYAARVIPAPASPCMPQPSALQLVQPVITLNAGTYCHSIVIPLPSTLVLNPGVYVFADADLRFLAAGTLKGSGVSLVFTSTTGTYYGTLASALALSVTLTPMTAGPTAGIAIWLDPNGALQPIPQTLGLVGVASVLAINGAIYAPAAEVDLVGIAATAQCTQIVAYRIAFLGAGSVRHVGCAAYGVVDVTAYRLLE